MKDVHEDGEDRLICTVHRCIYIEFSKSRLKFYDVYHRRIHLSPTKFLYSHRAGFPWVG